MKTSFRPLLVPLALAALLFAGCETRSISNSGYRGDGRHRYSAPRDFSYRGELKEFDVLGIDPDASVSESDIQRALDSAQRVRLRKGSNLMLVQSGAFTPDGPMRETLGRSFNVIPFTGLPESPRAGTNYAKALRLAAAQGGCESIVCYWGTLESAQERYGTKAVSWVPIVGWAVPDEKQHLRIRLKLAVIDVRTGNWTLTSPEPRMDAAVSASLNRAGSDQKQVEKLKELAYADAADSLLKAYAN